MADKPAAAVQQLPPAERKNRLLRILDGWRSRLARLEETAVAHFQEQDLDKISELLVDKRRIEQSIAAVDAFVREHLP